MNQILENETEIIGQYLLVNNELVVNENVERVYNLINNNLKFLSVDESGWDALYIDESDLRLWERIYLESHLHGGGPPSLFLISYDNAKKNIILFLKKSLICLLLKILFYFFYK